MEKSVLFISVHQDRLYPLDTGSDKDVGVRQGIGFNINIPLPPGSGIGACE
jgi:acetoin utilization deacetylase AcuC-like enzyme